MLGEHKMKNFLKKLLGFDELENRISQAAEQQQDLKKEIERLEKIAQDAKEAERIANLNPKDLATENKEPWVAVLQTHVNKDNMRNGFFELDWNEYFVLELRKAGYTGATDEEVVDRWFQERCRDVAEESNISMENRGSGFVNRALRDDGRSEVS